MRSTSLVWPMRTREISARNGLTKAERFWISDENSSGVIGGFWDRWSGFREN